MYKNFTIIDNEAVNVKENYIIYHDWCFKGTSLDNYQARIINHRIIINFEGFTSFEECIDYFDTYLRRAKK